MVILHQSRVRFRHPTACGRLPREAGSFLKPEIVGTKAFASPIPFSITSSSTPLIRAHFCKIRISAIRVPSPLPVLPTKHLLLLLQLPACHQHQLPPITRCIPSTEPRPLQAAVVGLLKMKATFPKNTTQIKPVLQALPEPRSLTPSSSARRL